MLCVICHDGIGTGEGKVFECGHVFHGECVDNWFQTNQHATCPQCRKVVDPTSARTLYVAIESPQPRSGASYRDQSSVIASQFKRIEELSNEKEKMEKVFDDKNKQLQALQKEMQDHYKKYQSLLEEKDDLENICNELYSKLAEIEVLKRSSSTIKAGCACVQAELDNLLVICGASTLRRPRDASLNNGELAGVSSACCTRRSSAVKESVIGNAANGATAVISTSQNTAAASRQSASTVTRSTVASRSRATAATSRPRFITSTRSSAAREAAAPVASRSQVAASRPQVAASRPQVAASRPQVAASRPLAIEPRPSAVSHLYMSADILSAAAEHSRRTSGGRPSSDVIQPPDSRRSPLASLSTTHGLPSSSYSRPALRSVDNAAATRRSERLVTRPR